MRKLTLYLAIILLSSCTKEPTVKTGKIQVSLHPIAVNDVITNLNEVPFNVTITDIPNLQNYTINYGDGISETMNVGQNPSHKYSAGGNYTVVVQAYDNDEAYYAEFLLSVLHKEALRIKRIEIVNYPKYSTFNGTYRSWDGLNVPPAPYSPSDNPDLYFMANINNGGAVLVQKSNVLQDCEIGEFWDFAPYDYLFSADDKYYFNFFDEDPGNGNLNRENFSNLVLDLNYYTQTKPSEILFSCTTPVPTEVKLIV